MTDSDKQAKLFKALMHPARLEILDVLRNGEQCVCHMEAVLGYRQAYISQQLMVLREAQLVDDRRDGWNIFYRVIKPDVFGILDAARELLGEPESSSLLSTTNTCPCPHCQNQSGNREQYVTP